MKKILIISMLLISSPLFSGHHATGEMSNAEVVKKAYATFGSGDIEGWKKLHASDLKFTIFGDLPQSGVHYGADAVIKNVFDVIAIHWPAFNLKNMNIDSVGDTVYVLNHMTADGLDTYALHMFTLEDGKIKSFTAFDDTDSMRSSMIE